MKSLGEQALDSTQYVYTYTDLPCLYLRKFQFEKAKDCTLEWTGWPYLLSHSQNSLLDGSWVNKETACAPELRDNGVPQHAGTSRSHSFFGAWMSLELESL